MGKPYEYTRILEILNDYWIDEPDEEYVEVLMHFKKHDGQEQRKVIRWKNPKFINKNASSKKLKLSDLSEECKCTWCGK